MMTAILARMVDELLVCVHSPHGFVFMTSEKKKSKNFKKGETILAEGLEKIKQVAKIGRFAEKIIGIGIEEERWQEFEVVQEVMKIINHHSNKITWKHRKYIRHYYSQMTSINSYEGNVSHKDAAVTFASLKDFLKTPLNFYRFGYSRSKDPMSHNQVLHSLLPVFFSNALTTKERISITKMHIEGKYRLVSSRELHPDIVYLSSTIAICIEGYNRFTLRDMSSQSILASTDFPLFVAPALILGRNGMSLYIRINKILHVLRAKEHTGATVGNRWQLELVNLCVVIQDALHAAIHRLDKHTVMLVVTRTEHTNWYLTIYTVIDNLCQMARNINIINTLYSIKSKHPLVAYMNSQKIVSCKFICNEKWALLRLGLEHTNEDTRFVPIGVSLVQTTSNYKSVFTFERSRTINDYKPTANQQDSLFQARGYLHMLEYSLISLTLVTLHPSTGRLFRQLDKYPLARYVASRINTVIQSGEANELLLWRKYPKEARVDCLTINFRC